MYSFRNRDATTLTAGYVMKMLNILKLLQVTDYDIERAEGLFTSMRLIRLPVRARMYPYCTIEGWIVLPTENLRRNLLRLCSTLARRKTSNIKDSFKSTQPLIYRFFLFFFFFFFFFRWSVWWYWNTVKRTSLVKVIGFGSSNKNLSSHI